MILSLENLKKLDWNISGIYKLVNNYSKKIYIGQSINIRKRLREHLGYMKSNNYNAENNLLVSAWNKYGENVFNFEILEECNIDILDEREIFWINHYDSYNNGYNQTIGGQYNALKHDFTDKERKELSDIHDPEPVLQIDFNGNIINEYWSVAQASKLNDIDSRGIYSCCNRGISKSSKGYIWIYKKDYESFDLDYYLNKKQKKQVCKYDLYGNLIKIYKHGCEVKNDGFEPCQVNSCCNRNRSSVGGYVWRFLNDSDDLTNEYLKKIRSNLKRLKPIKINKLDYNGNIIKTYTSFRDVIRDGFNKKHVSDCCNGTIEYYCNYKWEYA